MALRDLDSCDLFDPSKFQEKGAVFHYFRKKADQTEDRKEREKGEEKEHKKREK